MKTRKPRGRDMNLDVECPSLCLLFFFSRFGGDQHGQWMSTGLASFSLVDHHRGPPSGTGYRTGNLLLTELG